MNLLILHSHFLSEHWEPWKEYEARLIEWAEQLIKSKVEHILLTGWAATPNIPIFHAEAAKAWLVKNWINPEALTTEKTWAKETVWELVFSRTEHDNDLLLPENNITLLSSDYHLRRLKIIANLVFWGRDIKYIGISWFDRSIEDEDRSIQAFLNTFAWVPIGDIKKIEDALWRNHWLYRDHPFNPYRLDLSSKN